MERAKEKIRLANEQLMKEEQAAAEEENRRRQKEEAIAKSKEVISLDLTQSDGEEDDQPNAGDLNSKNFINKTNKLIDDVVRSKNEEERIESNYGMYKAYDRMQSPSDDDSQHYNNDNCTPNPFGYDNSVSSKPTSRIKDPRLRKGSNHHTTSPIGQMDAGMSNVCGPTNFNNFNPNFNDQQTPTPSANSIEQNFVILKNCPYATRINDVAQLLLTANLALKHIEPLCNDRQLPTGEFIVEFRRSHDAEIAVNRFHNIQFMNRSLRVFPIAPQEIANRLNKPFLGYIPGGNGIKVSDLKSLAVAMNVSPGMISRLEWSGTNNNSNFNFRNNSNNNNRFETNDINYSNNNNNRVDMNEAIGSDGLPERFCRPGCVLELENVPYKAQLSDILNFFHGFELKSEDIIRRFNDVGQPTGDARVAFDSPEAARKALDARKRKQIFNRTIYMKILN
uniref:RNA recognition motif protein n=1 Tax=Musca domestica TaxID=7370 RepID=T1PKU6_MUSDO